MRVKRDVLILISLRFFIVISAEGIALVEHVHLHSAKPVPNIIYNKLGLACR